MSKLTQQILLRILGGIFWQTISPSAHISAVCSSCFYHISNLQCIHHHLDLDSAKLLANALVSSRLDYCNSLFYQVLQTMTAKFQCVQNRLAHIVTKSPPFTCSFPLLHSCHWLPVKVRIVFKTFADLQNAVKNRLSSLWSLSLRSDKGISLSVPRVKTNTDARACHSFSISVEQPPAVCLFSHFSCNLLEASEDTSWSGLHPTDTSRPDGSLMLQNCFIDFAVEHWFGCRATEPGYVGHIGAIEIWLIDWLIIWVYFNGPIRPSG